MKPRNVSRYTTSSLYASYILGSHAKYTVEIYHIEAEN